MKRACRSAVRARIVETFRLCERVVAIEMHPSLNLRLDFVDACKTIRDKLSRGNPAFADFLGRLCNA